MNRVLYLAGDGGAVGSGELVMYRHLPYGFDVREGDGYTLAVSREFCSGDV